MSYAWGWLLSSERPDKGGTPVPMTLEQCMEPSIELIEACKQNAGDFIGAGIAIGGVLVAWFWPRQTQKRSERLPAALTQPASAAAL